MPEIRWARATKEKQTKEEERSGMNQRILYSVEEVAAMIGVPKKGLSRRCLLRQIKAVKVGREWRIPTSEVERIVKQGITTI